MKRVLWAMLLIGCTTATYAQDLVRVIFVDYFTGDTLRTRGFSVGDKEFSDLVTASENFFSKEWRFELESWLDLKKMRVEGYEVKSVYPEIRPLYPFLPNRRFTFSLIPQTYQLKKVVLPGNVNPEKRSSSVSVISKSELIRDQQLTIAPVLNRVPGVYMHMGTLGTSRLTIRGIGARSLFSTTKVKAYLENIPLSTGDGETTIEDLDLPLIDKVTVVRGPASSLFGAGLGGVLLMESDASLNKGKGVSALLQYGSFNTQRASINAHAGDGKSGIGIHANYLSSEGWRENNQYDRFQASLQARFLIDEKSTLSILGTVLDVKGFIPSSIDSATFADNPESAAFTWRRTAGNEDYAKGLLGLNYTRVFNKVWKLQSSLPLTYRANDELRPFNFLRESALTAGNRTVIEGNPLVGGKVLQVFLGEEIFQEFYAWQTYENIGGLGDVGGILSNNREQRRYINAFAQLDYPLTSQLDVILGTNFNKTWYDYEDFFFADSIDLSGDYSFRGIFSPRLALNYELNSQHVLNAQVSHGFSPPQLSETLTPDGQINPEIQPETGWNYELGLKGNFGKRNLEQFSYSVTAYWLDANNLLVPKRVGNDQFVGENAGRTRHLGLESEVSFVKVIYGGWNLLGWGSYSFMDHRFVDFQDEERGEVYDGNFIPGIPQHTANLGLDIRFFHLAEGQELLLQKKRQFLTVSVNSQFVGGMPLRNDNVLESAPYQVWNAKVSLNQHIRKHNSIMLGLGVQNIFDALYASMILVNAGSFGGRAPRYFYPGMPRNFYIDLQFNVNSKK